MSDDPKTILIVEDDPSTRSLLVALMRRDRLESAVASNAQEALALLRERTFDLILLDLMLPGVSGHEVVAFVRAEGRGEPVIVCTAAGPRATAEIDRSTVSAVIQKPFDVDELMSVVASILKKRE
jgi:DNA-binding NtrC family response regulator